LRYLQLARQIVNFPIVNGAAARGLLSCQRGETAELRQLCQRLQRKGSALQKEAGMANKALSQELRELAEVNIELTDTRQTMI